MDVCIDSDTRAAGWNIPGDFTRTRCKVVRMVLGVDSAFNCDAGMLNIFLAEFDGMTAGNL